MSNAPSLLPKDIENEWNSQEEGVMPTKGGDGKEEKFVLHPVGPHLNI